MKDILSYVSKAKMYISKNRLDDFGDLLNESWQKKEGT